MGLRDPFVPLVQNAMPITTAIAQFAANLKFEDLSPDSIYQAKRFLLDSLGCALGGYRVHDVRIALEVLDETAASDRKSVV